MRDGIAEGWSTTVLVVERLSVASCELARYSNHVQEIRMNRGKSDPDESFLVFWRVLVDNLCRGLATPTTSNGAEHVRARRSRDVDRLWLVVRRVYFVLNRFILRARDEKKTTTPVSLTFFTRNLVIARLARNPHTSRSERNPSALSAVWCTKISSEPSSGMMNPNPFTALNHFTYDVSTQILASSVSSSRFHTEIPPPIARFSSARFPSRPVDSDARALALSSSLDHTNSHRRRRHPPNPASPLRLDTHTHGASFTHGARSPEHHVDVETTVNAFV